MSRIREVSSVLQAAVLSATLLLGACVPTDTPTLQRGDPAPAFSATSLLVGDTVHLKDYRGKTVLLNLWATWCRPCLTEIPYLQRIHEEFADQGLVVVGVSVDAALHRDAVIEFVEKMGVTYDILLDPESRSEKIFLARGLPNSVLIDRKGVIAFSWLGTIQEDDPTFLRGLHDALGTEN